MAVATHLQGMRMPVLLPGITLNTSPTHYNPLEQMRLQRFNKKTMGVIWHNRGVSTPLVCSPGRQSQRPFRRQMRGCIVAIRWQGRHVRSGSWPCQNVLPQRPGMRRGCDASCFFRL